MKDFHEMLTERHSIRHYTDQELEPEQVKLILESALLAPTSKASRAWQFVVIDDRDTLTRLVDCKNGGTTPLKSCRMAVAVCVDPSKSEAWIEDGSVAASFMILQAENLGIASCWVEVRGRFTTDGIPSEEYVRELLGIPDSLNPLCIVTFGFSAETRKSVDTSKLLWENVHIGQFRNDD